MDQITPLILTCNEAANIRRTLSKLDWADRIVIIDSGSIDETLEIVCEYPQAEIIYRPFENFADQCNFGLAQISTPWVLSLDADFLMHGPAKTRYTRDFSRRRRPADRGAGGSS